MRERREKRERRRWERHRQKGGKGGGGEEIEKSNNFCFCFAHGKIFMLKMLKLGREPMMGIVK